MHCIHLVCYSYCTDLHAYATPHGLYVQPEQSGSRAVEEALLSGGQCVCARQGMLHWYQCLSITQNDVGLNPKPGSSEMFQTLSINVHVNYAVYIACGIPYILQPTIEKAELFHIDLEPTALVTCTCTLLWRPMQRQPKHAPILSS